MTETIKGSIVLITGATGAIAQALIAALITRGIAQGLTHDPKAVERQLASPG